METDTDLFHWDSCEVHGHNYEDVDEEPGTRRCSDCGESLAD